MASLNQAAARVNRSPAKTLRTEAACLSKRKPSKPAKAKAKAKAKPSPEARAKSQAVIEYDDDLQPVRVIARGLTIEQAMKRACTVPNAVQVDSKTIEHFQEGSGYEGMPEGDAKHLRWRIQGAAKAAASLEDAEEFTDAERSELAARVDRMAGLVRSGKIKTAYEVGMMARALDRFCAEREDQRPDMFGRLRSPHFDEGHSGDVADNELQAELEAPVTEPPAVLFDVVVIDGLGITAPKLEESGCTLNSAVAYSFGFNEGADAGSVAVVVPHGTIPDAVRRTPAIEPETDQEGKPYRVVIVHNDGNVYIEPGRFESEEANAFVENFDDSEGTAWIAQDRENVASTKLEALIDGWVAKLNLAHRQGLITDCHDLARVSESLRQLAQDNCELDEGWWHCFIDGKFDDKEFATMWHDCHCCGTTAPCDEVLGTRSSDTQE